MKVLIDGDQDEAGRRIADVDLPPGYRRVWHGATKPGIDLALHIPLAAEGIIQWMPVLACPPPLNDADSYPCVIRPETTPGPDKGCEHCEVRGAVPGERYCRNCGYIIVQEGRRRLAGR